MEERRELIIDHLGSPVMVVKYFYDTEVAKELKYNSFGQVTYDSAPDFDFPFRFAGGIYDEDTKLIRFGVRDYDPETGRWTSVEPLGFAGSRNWYVYVNNNPVNFRDPTGLNPINVKYFQVSLNNMSKIDLFARLILQSLICKSIKNNREYAGWIVKTDFTDFENIARTPGTKDSSNYNPIPDDTYTTKVTYHTHGTWTKGYSNEFFSGTDIDIIRGKYNNGTLKYNGEAFPGYLATTLGKMIYAEYDAETNTITAKRFPDLDLSKCKCPNRSPYNNPNRINKCGSYK